MPPIAAKDDERPKRYMLEKTIDQIEEDVLATKSPTRQWRRVGRGLRLRKRGLLFAPAYSAEPDGCS
jgi:hypothetical protein